MTLHITESVWLNASDICSLEHIAEVSGLSQEDILDLVHTGVLPPPTKTAATISFIQNAWLSLTGRDACVTILSSTRKASLLPCGFCAGWMNSKPNSPTLKVGFCAQSAKPLLLNPLTSRADKWRLKTRPNPLRLRFVWPCYRAGCLRPFVL